jgi:hypothetical protein
MLALQPHWLSAALTIAQLLVWMIIVAVLAPPISKLLRSGTESIRKIATLCREQSTKLQRVLSDLFDQLRGERKLPLIVALTDIAEASRSIGESQHRKVTILNDRLTANVDRIADLAGSAPSAEDPPATSAAGAQPMSPGVFVIVATLLATVAFGGLNATLLSLFFTEQIHKRVLTDFFENLQLGTVIAALFLCLEFVIGALGLHAATTPPRTTEVPRNRSFADRFFGAPIAWFMIAILGLIEAFAYGSLSARIGMDRQLGLPAGSLAGFIARWFLVPLGPGMTLTVAWLGRRIAEMASLNREARRIRRAERREARRWKQQARAVERMRGNLEQVTTALTTFPNDVAVGFMRALHLPDREGQAALTSVLNALLIAAEGRVIIGPLPVASESPVLQVRTATNVIADLVMFTISAMLLLVAIVLVGSELVLAIPTRSRVQPVAEVFAFALPAFVAWLGFIGRRFVFRPRQSTMLEQAVPDSRSRRFYTGVAVSLIGLSAILIVSLLTYGHVIGRDFAGRAILGVLETGVLVVLGAFADSMAMAVLHTGYVAVLLGARGVLFLATMALGLGGGTIGVMDFLLRLAAIPGKTLLRLRGALRSIRDDSDNDDAASPATTSGRVHDAITQDTGD